MMATPLSTSKQGTAISRATTQDSSRTVSSNQRGLHPRLAATLSRHLQAPFLRPVSSHALRAFTELERALADKPRPLVLDSFCGTGESSAALAARHPEHLVIGIDQSGHRLARHKPTALSNYRLLHAPAEDIWRLLLDTGLRVDYHYLLYPNPWPKAHHLQRRVHGHASFAWLLELGGRLELRSNWQLYVEEFGTAMHLAGHRGLVAQIPGSPPITAFERKYLHSGHSLWRYCGAVTNTAE